MDSVDSKVDVDPLGEATNNHNHMRDGDKMEIIFDPFPTTFEDYGTQLCNACAEGNIDHLPLLLQSEFGIKKGINFLVPCVAYDDKSGRHRNKFQNKSPLTVATERGQIEIMRELLKYEGVNVNILCGNQHDFDWADKQSSLILAATQGLYYGVHERNEYGRSKTLLAVDLECARLLLSRDDIDINYAPKRSGKTAIHLAIVAGNLDLLRLLIKHPRTEINQADRGGNTAIHYASKLGNLKMLRLLIKHPRAKFNQENGRGNTPLHVAINNSHPHAKEVENCAIAMFLLERLLERGPGDGGQENIVQISIFTDMYDPKGTIDFYRYARGLPIQHQQLLDFHLCRCVASRAESLSPLRVFRYRWEGGIGRLVESFLLPSKKVRTLLVRVVSRFDALINDTSDSGNTLLWHSLQTLHYNHCEDGPSLRVDDFRLLLEHRNIDVNKMCRIHYYPESTTNYFPDTEVRERGYETVLRFFNREIKYSIEWSPDDGDVKQQLLQLFHDAGGIEEKKIVGTYALETSD